MMFSLTAELTVEIFEFKPFQGPPNMHFYRLSFLSTFWRNFLVCEQCGSLHSRYTQFAKKNAQLLQLYLLMRAFLKDIKITQIYNQVLVYCYDYHVNFRLLKLFNCILKYRQYPNKYIGRYSFQRQLKFYGLHFPCIQHTCKHTFAISRKQQE